MSIIITYIIDKPLFLTVPLILDFGFYSMTPVAGATVKVDLFLAGSFHIALLYMCNTILLHIK